MIRKKVTACSIGTLLLCVVLAAQFDVIAGSQFPPRQNASLRDTMSGIVLYGPTSHHETADGIDTPPDPLLASLESVPIGPNVVCNQDTGSQQQNEPSIAVNPHNPLHVIASSNDYRNQATGGDVQPGYYVSFDGGQTWPGDGVIELIPPAEAGGDPALAIYDSNNVYFAYIAFHRSQDDVGGVYVSKSGDGGLTWGTPVPLALNTLTVFHDKEYIAVDTFSSAHDGNIYVSWTRFEFSSPIYFSRSTDGGNTFSPPIQISDSGLSTNQGSVPAVGPNGQVYVVWYNYNTGGHRMAVSLDGGQTFGTPFPVASVNPIPSPLPGSSFRNNSFPTLAVDQNTGNLYVGWNDYAHQDADIFFVRSTNGGQTWSSPIRINDDPIGNDHHQFFPWLSVAPDGALYAGWFDSRLDPNPYSAPLYYDSFVAVSTDEGLGFGANTRVSTISSDSSVGFSGQFIGDYSGIAATDSFVYPAWVDTRRGHQDIFTQSSTLNMSKTAPAELGRYQVFTYSLILNSSSIITGNSLSDPLPPEVTYVPDSLWASSGYRGEAGNVITWTGTITNNQPVTITFQVTPSAECGSRITNTATLTEGANGLLFQATTHTQLSGTPPQASFTPSNWLPIQGELVVFTNQSTGTLPIQFSWNFGDGVTSTVESPSHAYALLGPYTVTLVATDRCGIDASSATLEVQAPPVVYLPLIPKE